LEIYTDKDGEVIFKKYSLMGDLQTVAGQICETLYKTTGCPAVITDRDTVIAVSGAPRRELSEHRISPALEGIMEGRQLYQYHDGEAAVSVTEDGVSSLTAALAAPILSEGDVMGCVVLSGRERGRSLGETENTRVQTMSGFLARHL
ncbi:MAG: stage V sporulation protein T, partial [Clostridiales bacterium]|nr:stage V sporulation protein T [Clostridiales bacterium]